MVDKIHRARVIGSRIMGTGIPALQDEGSSGILPRGYHAYKSSACPSDSHPSLVR